MRNIVILNSLHFSYPLPILMRVSYNTLIVKQNTSDYYKYIYKAWSPENTQSDIPQWQFNDLYSVKTSDRFLTNASSISIQNIQLGYTFSKKTLRSLYLTNLRIYVACDNVYYWSKRKGFDSRVTWNGNKDSSGEYSAVRAFSAGLSLQF